jgi:DedD protein
MSENDSQLELKKRARRRLVGAIALAVLAAIMLPMVMDQEPKPVAQDIQIRIPNQDAGSFTSRILPVKPGSTPTPLPPATVPEARLQSAVKPDTPAAKAEPSKSEPANPEPPKADQARADAALNGGEQWIVQIGAYRDPTNVRNLQAKLKEQGYNFYVEPLVSDGVKKTRVRAGPFPSKEAAERARERLKRIGVDGVVAQK